MSAPRVCVVIPHYREQLDAAERASLPRCTELLAAWPQILLLPPLLPGAPPRAESRRPRTQAL